MSEMNLYPHSKENEIGHINSKGVPIYVSEEREKKRKKEEEAYNNLFSNLPKIKRSLEIKKNIEKKVEVDFDRAEIILDFGEIYPQIRRYLETNNSLEIRFDFDLGRECFRGYSLGKYNYKVKVSDEGIRKKQEGIDELREALLTYFPSELYNLFFEDQTLRVESKKGRLDLL